jgi:hypothetical protein
MDWLVGTTVQAPYTIEVQGLLFIQQKPLFGSKRNPPETFAKVVFGFKPKNYF